MDRDGLAFLVVVEMELRQPLHEGLVAFDPELGLSAATDDLIGWDAVGVVGEGSDELDATGPRR